MKSLSSIVALGVAVLVVIGWVPSSAQYGGALVAQAQDAKRAEAKGVKTRNLVTSLGGFRATANVPIVLTGQVVELEPGGQTGRERYLVPAYIYVLEGTLTTDTDGGPIGIAGVQYHGTGQSYVDPGGIWHNFSNPGSAPVKYLLLLIGTPGGATTQKSAED
jgi:quercetin dioxygenase-like cupin family protein